MATFKRYLASHDTITSTSCLELRIAIQGHIVLLFCFGIWHWNVKILYIQVLIFSKNLVYA